MNTSEDLLPLQSEDLVKFPTNRDGAADHRFREDRARLSRGWDGFVLVSSGPGIRSMKRTVPSSDYDESGVGSAVISRYPAASTTTASAVLDTIAIVFTGPPMTKNAMI